MKKLLVLILFCRCCFFSAAQTPKIDSLLQLVHAAKTNAAALQAIEILYAEYHTLHTDTLWKYALQAAQLADRAADKSAATIARLMQARAYMKWGNIDSAKALVEPELKKYSVENAGTRAIYFKLRELTVEYAGNANNYKDALALLYDIIKQADRYKDSLVQAECMNILSVLNYDMDFVAAGRAWGYKGLSLTSGAARFSLVVAILNLNLAENYWWIKQLDSADYCINKAVAILRQLQNLYYLSRALQIKASIFTARKNYTAAEQFMVESIRTMEKIDSTSILQDKLIVLASIYEHNNQTDKAIAVLKAGLATDTLARSASPHAVKNADAADLQQVFYYEELARCYQHKGDTKNYAACLEKVIAGKDAFNKANSAQAIAELEIKYEVQKKETTIAQQRLSLITKNYVLYGSVLLAFLGVIIGWLFLKDYRRKQFIALQQLREEEKRHSLQAVASAKESERKRIAADLHDNLGAQLSYIKRNVHLIIDQPESFNREDGRKYLTVVNDTAQHAMIDLRETIWVLNKDEVNIQEFADKLKSYVKQQLMERDNIRCQMEDDITSHWKLSSGQAMHIFRIVQEVINNTIKHAGADKLDIRFNSNNPGKYQLSVSDNGKGFDSSNKYENQYGLENMTNRAKELQALLIIHSLPGKGTTIILQKE